MSIRLQTIEIKLSLKGFSEKKKTILKVDRYVIIFMFM